MSREQAISDYAKHFDQNQDLQKALYTLCRKNLGCWCHPEACHGQVLINKIKELLFMA
jgi:hemoglobin-like flavoprotein